MFRLHNGIPVFGEHDPNTLEQLTDVASRATRAAIMADGHFGYIMPVGGVTGYVDQVSVAGVGYDIACGNAAIRTDLKLQDITKNGFNLSYYQHDPRAVQHDPLLGELASDIYNTISFGMQRRTNTADDAPVDHPLFEGAEWSIIPKQAVSAKTGHIDPDAPAARERLRDKAREQLGTVGTGNHYVDVLVDESGSIWVGVHFGSRGLGHTIATGFLACSVGAPWGSRSPEVEALVSLQDPIGQDYWALMSLAGQYAYAGREWVARKVVQILGAQELELVHNHHNFAWKEQHFVSDGAEPPVERELVVVRKGATPAFPGQLGFVGGSMGDDAVILRGATSTDDYVRLTQSAALYSTVHGAGRVMSRTAAKKGRVLETHKGPSGQVTTRDTSTIVTRQMMQEWLNKRGVVLRGADVDESPHAYRRLHNVLAAQGSTVEVLHRLRPVIVCMAPSDTRDPYKD